MHVFSDAQAICAAPNAVSDPELARLLSDEAEQASAADLAELTCIAVITADDTDADLERELGLSLLTNPVSGCRYGEPGFEPHWAWLEACGNYTKVIVTIGDSGFAHVLFLEKGTGELAALCRTYG